MANIIFDDALEYREGLTKSDIEDWIKHSPRKYKKEDFSKYGFKVEEEIMHDHKLYFIDSPYGKYYVAYDMELGGFRKKIKNKKKGRFFFGGNK